MQDARINMIENQLRAGGVHAQKVFEAVSAIRREEFVPPDYRNTLLPIWKSLFPMPKTC